MAKPPSQRLAAFQAARKARQQAQQREKSDIFALIDSLQPDNIQQALQRIADTSPLLRACMDRYAPLLRALYPHTSPQLSMLSNLPPALQQNDCPHTLLNELIRFYRQIEKYDFIIYYLFEVVSLPLWLVCLPELLEVLAANPHTPAQIVQVDFSEQPQLLQLPPDPPCLQQLEQLSLASQAQLAAFLPLFPSFRRLMELKIPHCQLKDCPQEIQHLSQLYELDLSHNYLSDLPDSLHQIKQLSSIHLEYNRFSKIPPVIGQLPQLNVLHLEGNNFNHLLHPKHFDCLRSLPALQNLFLGNCQIQRVPDFIFNLPALHILDLSDNRLTELPPTLSGTHSPLQWLELRDNAFSAFPAPLCSFCHLEQLDMEHCTLSALPDNIDQMQSLQGLYLNDNQLTILPESLFNIPTLHNLILSNNPIRQLPSTIRQATGLRKLFLRYTLLSQLPPALPPSLTYLDISHTPLAQQHAAVEQLRQSLGSACTVVADL